MDKAKTQDDRHRANLDALGNLQTLLVSSAGMSAWKG
jgi:hypothetical protein